MAAIPKKSAASVHIFRRKETNESDTNNQAKEKKSNDQTNKFEIGNFGGFRTFKSNPLQLSLISRN